MKQSRHRQRQQEQQAGEPGYKFALIPKGKCGTLGPFFLEIIAGCQQRAEELGVSCTCFGKDNFPKGKQKQEDIIANLTSEGIVDGIAIAARFPDEIAESISNAVDAGIPVITFDSDAPSTRRSAYIGTDNYAMGKELGKVLKQLRPRGGKYALVSAAARNMKERERGIREALQGTTWTELGGGASPLTGGNNATGILEKMWALADSYPDLGAFVPVLGTPMRAKRWNEFATHFRDRIALVNTDWSDDQLDKLSKGYVDGLVGQLPFEMGQQTMNVLLQLQSSSEGVATEIFGTNFIEILRVPYNLPPPDVDYNYLGSLTIIGYCSFAIIAGLSMGCAAWTCHNRNQRVVKASQPLFLYLICVGVLTFGSSIIPFGIDDENHSLRGCDIACMSAPWLVSMGFVLVFSVLFSKTWRVNRLFHNPNKFKRIKVTTKDVMLPLVLLMTANAIVLSCWTALSPLRYVREDGLVTDLWNRVIESSASCKSTSGRKGESIPYVVLIGLINLGAVVIAIVQAYIARDIQTEFSESKYIALVLASIMQAAVIGIPVLALEHKNPQANYVIQTVLVFALSVAILLLMFVPKFMILREWHAKQEKKKFMKENNFSIGTTLRTTQDDGSGGLKVMVRKSVLRPPGMNVICEDDISFENEAEAKEPAPKQAELSTMPGETNVQITEQEQKIIPEQAVDREMVDETHVNTVEEERESITDELVSSGD